MAETRLIQPETPGLSYRIRSGIDETQPLVIMLHGWTGDERGMWVFDKVLPGSWWIATFRGPYTAPDGGYSWTAESPRSDPRLSDFASSVDFLMHTIVDLEDRFKLQRERFVLMGFSQGAAMAFSVPSLTHWSPAAIVALAGYMPKDATIEGDWIPIFWGHGIRDEIIPIDIARVEVERLRDGGAQVQYCEADVGHKAGLECARGLKTWLTQMLMAH